MSKYLFGVFLSCVVATVGFTGPASAVAIAFKSWEVASEFNENFNPLGVWNYGSETALNVGFATLPNACNLPTCTGGPLTGWQLTANPNDGPYILHNPTNLPQGPFGGAFVKYPPHALSLHPGVNCEYAVLRFKVPVGGKYRISGQFYAMDYNAGTTTDVHVSINGAAPAFNGLIDFGASVTSASFTPLGLFNLVAGDTIDFQVGCGGNGTYFSDTTGLNAVIERK
jgi:hypothetical protein